MALPPRPFHTLNDIAMRWAVIPIDIVGWAADGLLALSIAVPPTTTASSRVLCDLVEIAGTDVLPLFRPDGARLERVAIRRIRAHGETEWQWISEPAVFITAPDVLVTRTEVQRFERQHELYGGAAPRDMQGPARRGRRRAAGPGAPPRYDWDTFFVAITRRIYAHGLPSTQGELVREMLDWFQARQDEHAPDESMLLAGRCRHGTGRRRGGSGRHSHHLARRREALSRRCQRAGPGDSDRDQKTRCVTR
jgi:hypothetical protein